MKKSGNSVVMLDASEFRISPAYQRDPVERLSDLQRIANKWEPNKLGVIHVTRRSDGETYIIDGAGRAYTFYKILGYTGKMPCVVWPAMSVAKEAEVFVDLNRDRKTVNSGDMFKASVASGNAEDVEIARIFEEAGMTLGRESGVKNISSVASAREVYRRGNGALANALATKNECWPDSVCSGGLLEGIALFQAAPGYTEDGLNKVLRANLPKSILATLKDNHGGRAPLKRYVPLWACQLWVEKYNKNRQRNRVAFKDIKALTSGDWTTLED